MIKLHRKAARVTPFVLATLVAAPSAYATDVEGVWPASLDLPRVFALFEHNGEVLSIDPNDDSAFIPIWAFLDTGASGILMGPQTRDLLQIPQAFASDGVTPVRFGDVGVAGTEFFDVSQTMTLKIADQHAHVVDPYVIDGDYSVFDTHVPAVRVQLGIPSTVEPPNPIDILRSTLDIIGMPAMRDRIVVMDPRPTNGVIPLIENPNAPIDDLDLEDIFIRTNVYEASDATAPIPATSHTVKMSYASFDAYTTTTPTGAQGPTLARNPFIGPSPVPNANGLFNDAPGVKLSYGGASTEASLLLDTGGSVSAIATHIADDLGITYDPANPLGSENPRLLGVPEEFQITTTIAGIGGELTIAGFFLEALLLRTEEGDLGNDLDPNHVRFLDAPVYVFDIALDENLTIDGILGMNFLSASTFFESDGTNFAFLAGRESPFSALVFNEPLGTLGLEVAPIPEPGAGALLLVGAVGVLARRRRGTHA